MELQKLLAIVREHLEYGEKDTTVLDQIEAGIQRLQNQLAAANLRFHVEKERYQRDVFGLNSEGDPIGGEPPSGIANELKALRVKYAQSEAQLERIYRGEPAMIIDPKGGIHWNPSYLGNYQGNFYAQLPPRVQAVPVEHQFTNLSDRPASEVPVSIRAQLPGAVGPVDIHGTIWGGVSE